MSVSPRARVEYCDPVTDLHQRMLDARATARDALLQANLQLIDRTHPSAAAGLLEDLIAGKMCSSVRVATLMDLCYRLDPATRLHVYLRAASARTYESRLVLDSLTWSDLLPLVSAIRDGKLECDPLIYLHDEIGQSALRLCSGRPLDSEMLTTVRTSCGPQMIFLLGAARDVAALERDLYRSSVYAWPRLNRDIKLARWALANPGITPSARQTVLRKCSVDVVVTLRNEGLLGTWDLRSWLVDRSSRTSFDEPFSERALQVLQLPSTVPGARAAKLSALYLLTDLSAVCSQLSRQDLQDLAALLPASDVEHRAAFVALLPEWAGPLKSLQVAVSRLRLTN